VVVPSEIKPRSFRYPDEDEQPRRQNFAHETGYESTNQNMQHGKPLLAGDEAP